MGVPGAPLRKEKAKNALNGGRAKEQKEVEGERAQLLSSSHHKYCALHETNTHPLQLCLLLPNREGSTNICLQEAAHELCMSPVPHPPTLTLFWDSTWELLVLQNHHLIVHNVVRKSLPNKPVQAAKEREQKNPTLTIPHKNRKKRER